MTPDDHCRSDARSSAPTIAYTRVLRHFIFWCTLFLACVLLLGSAAGAAGQGTPTPAGASSSIEQEAAPARETTEALETLIRQLEDPTERAALLAKLRALEVEDPAVPDARAATALDEFTDELRRRTDTLFAIAEDIADSADQLPALVSWIQDQVLDDEYRRVWVIVTGSMFSIIGLGLLARAMVLRLRQPLDPERPRSSVIQRFVVELLAAFVFGALTPGVLTLANLAVASEIVFFSIADVDLTLVAAAAMSLTGFYFVAMIWRAILRLIFGEPGTVGPLVPVTARTARIMRAGLFKIGQLGFVGFGLLFAFFQLGLPESLFLFLVYLLFLVVAGVAVFLVLRLRHAVAKKILSLHNNQVHMIFQIIPARLIARTWHYNAILFIILYYNSWSINMPGDPIILIRAFALVYFVVLMTSAAIFFLERAIFPVATGIAPPDAETASSPKLKPIYQFFLKLTLRLICVSASFVLIMAVWNDFLVIEVLSFLIVSEFGQGFLIFLIICLVVLLLDRIFIALIDNFERSGVPDLKDNEADRYRTISIYSRSFARVCIFFIGIAAFFSYIGVETTSILAGAGVFGAIIAFSWQTLIRDLLSGLFFIIGDHVGIGRRVEVAGVKGVVTKISMRTLTLKSGDGIDHAIPYSHIKIVARIPSFLR